MTHGIDTGFLVALEIIEHAEHAAARALLARLIQAGDRLALAPQVLAEFVHVVTDQRRFARPLDMTVARRIASEWWLGQEVDQVFPDDAATQLFFHLNGAASAWPQATARHATCRDLPAGGNHFSADHKSWRLRDFWWIYLSDTSGGSSSGLSMACYSLSGARIRPRRWHPHRCTSRATSSVI